VDISESLFSKEDDLICDISAPEFACLGSNCVASTMPQQNANYSWDVVGGEIIGDPYNESILWRPTRLQDVTLRLKISKQNGHSAVSRKNVTITSRNWPYSNLTVRELCNLARLPNANITYVNRENDPENQTYLNITAAINNVTCGGTVIISEGIYKEEIVINKPVNLRGLDKNNTIIIGYKNVIYVASDDVRIQNLTVQVD